MSLLGVDIGTSGVRVAGYSHSGELLASSVHDIALSHPAPGLVETDPEAVVAAAENGLRKVTAQLSERGHVFDAISFSSQGEAILRVGARNESLSAAPVSMDRRGVEMANRIRHSLGEQRVHKITGQPLHPMFSLYKIAAGAEAGTRHLAQYMCLDVFVATRLGARPATDYTMAARTGALDIHRLKWSEDMLAAATEACGSLLSTDIFPDIVSAGTVTGHVSREAAGRTGLIQGTPIVAGVHDQTASFLGAGGRASEKSVFALGSSDCLTVATPSRPDCLEDTGFASYPLAPNLWITLAGTAAGGWALEWLASIVREDLPGLFSRLPKTPPPLLVLPYMVGSGTLDNDPSAKGVIAGLTLNTTKEELGRAFVEAAGFELAKIVDALEQRHIKVGEIVAVGSGSANSHALDIRASAAGVLLQPFAGHASARGACLVAGAGVGLFPDLNSLPLADTGRASIPDPMHLAWYEKQRSHYADLYTATLQTTHSLDLRN